MTRTFSMTLLCVSSLCISEMVLGAEARPLLIKANPSGFGPPEYAASESCEVHLDHVNIFHSFGNPGGGGIFRTGGTISRSGSSTGVVMTERRDVKVSDSLVDVIRLAMAETVTKTAAGPCDAPGTYISMRLPDGTEGELFATGTCGSEGRERTGPYSTMLMNILDQFCPKTRKY